MENNINSGNLDFLFQPFERNRYFYSKLLTVQDFELEQQFFINKNRLMNCLVHGHGILYGLEVQDVIEPNQDNPQIKVKLSAGVALDCYGREIVVTDSLQENPIEGTYQPNQLNYLYLVYNEDTKDPVLALVDESKCDEKACTKGHIQETFKLTVSIDPPASIISGTVTNQGEGKPILGTKIEVIEVIESQNPEDPTKTDINEIVKAVTFSDESGKYELFVLAGKYQLQASALGYESKTISDVTVADSLEPIEAQNLILTPNATNSKFQSCKELTQDYYKDYLRFPPECNSPRVFLAVLEGEETIQVNEELTAKYRSIIYSNPMLYELLCNHLNNFNNPHRTTAEQVGALRSVNKVGNINNGTYVPNINLKSSLIQININSEPEKNTIDLNLEKDAVKLENLNVDVIEELLTSDGTITVTPNNTNKTINLSTNIDLSTNIATGVVTFLGITPRNFNVSREITPFLDKKIEGVAIIMALEIEKTSELAQFWRLAEVLLGTLTQPSYVFMGDPALVNPLLPLTIAFYSPEETFFKIFLLDRRERNPDVPPEIDWKVRWWAIPAKLPGQEASVDPRQDDTNIFASPVALKIAMNPGITRTELLKDIGINSTELQASLTQLQTEGLIRVEGQGNNRKFFLQ